MTFTQAEFNLRCEWGVAGITQLAPISDCIPRLISHAYINQSRDRVI